MAKDLKKKIIKYLKIGIPLSIGIWISWFFWNKYTPEQQKIFIDVFKESNYFILFLSFLVGFISHLSRAIRWKYMLRAVDHEPSLRNTFNAVMIGYVANLVVPRMGEASRAGVMKGAEGIPFEKAFGTIVAERVIDVLCLGLITSAAFLINTDQLLELKSLIEQMAAGNSSETNGTPIWTYIVAGVLGAGIVGLGVVYFINEAIRNKINELIKGFKDGLLTIFTLKDRWAYLTYTLLIWGCYVGMFWITFFAWEGTANFSFAAMLSAFIAGTVGFIIMQGGIGTYQVLVASVLTFYSQPAMLIEENLFLPEYFGFATLVWITQTLLIVILGLTAMMLVKKNPVLKEAKS